MPIVGDRLPPSLPIGPQVTPEGYVRLLLRAATFGRVHYEDGIAWVDPEALADPEYLASMKGNPVYLEEHPDEPTPPGYADAYSVGRIVSAEWVDGEIYTELEIRSPRGLAYGDERNWTVCASLGYDAERRSPGKNGADFIQLRSRNYHITLTDTPRHGPRARAINTAYDSLGVGGSAMLEKIVALLVAAGLAPEKAAEAAAQVMEAAKPAAEPADADPKKANPEAAAAMDSLRRQAADALKARDAALAALDAERIESCRPAVIDAAKAQGLTVGDKLDVPALAAQVLAARGVNRTGLDAAMFLRDSARFGVVADKAQTQASDSQRRAGTPDPTLKGGAIVGAEY